MSPRLESVEPLLEIRLFGRFEVRVNGALVDELRWERRSAKALVKLLALTPAHTLHRDQVIEALWPQQDPAAGQNSLNKAIHGARRALEPGLAKGSHSRFILTPSNQVVLSAPGLLWVDVPQFELAANAAIRAQDPDAARQALAFYGGALLVDDLYEGWTLTRRELMRLLFRTTSVSAAQGFAHRGEPVLGIEIAQRMVLDDPADETAHQLMMSLYQASGQRDLALQQFDRATHAAAAAGAALGPGIVALERSLRAQPGTIGNTHTPLVGGAAPAPWSPHIEPITFEPGVLRTARLSAHGRSVIMNANRAGGGFQLCRLLLGSGAVCPLPWHNAELFAVLPNGDLAIGVDGKRRNVLVSLSTLMLVPAAGGAPVTVLDDVQWADAHPGPGHATAASTPAQAARSMAVVRDVDGKNRLEFPIGTVRHQSAGWISHPRFSPTGRHLAFIEHRIENDDDGEICVVDLQADAPAARTLAAGFLGVQGLAWMDDAIWFTAARKGFVRSLYRVDLGGVERLMHEGPGHLLLHDCGGVPQRLLVSSDKRLVGTLARHATDAAERNISWHTHTTPRDISADGQRVLVEESTLAGRQRFAAYLRAIDGSATRSIAEGVPLVLAPDQRTVILRVPAARSALTVLDSRTGVERLLPNDDAHPLVHSEFVSFFPDGRRIAFSAADVHGVLRIYFQDLAGGKPVCFTPQRGGMRMPWNRAVSPDGQSIVLMAPDGGFALLPVAGGPAVPLKDLGIDHRLVTWHANGQDLFVYRTEGLPVQVYRYHVHTGALREWLSLNPSQVGPVHAVRRLRMTPDGQSYVYGYTQESSDLYLFDRD